MKNNENIEYKSERNSEFSRPVPENNKYTSVKNLDSFNDLNLDDKKAELEINIVEEEEIENEDNNNELFDPFFKSTETTLEYIKNKLKEYENNINL